MGKFLKNILFLIILLFFFLPMDAELQEILCTKPKVAVLLSVIQDEVFDHLNKQYPQQPDEVWLDRIQAKILKELRHHSPGIQFITVSGSISEDCDYYFDYDLSLIGAGETIEVSGLKMSEYAAFLMISTLHSSDRCGHYGMRFSTEITKDKEDIYLTIEHNIAAYGNIKELIDEHEDSHPVPPRGPELEISQEPEKVSPLERENKLDVKIQVINCEGNTVYDKHHGQRVILPKKTNRGELRPTEGFPQNSNVTEKSIILKIISPEGASATYTLKKGIKPGLEQVTLLTCGRDKNAVTETEIKIDGLKIEVTPQRRRLHPGEKTKIQVALNKVDIEGNKEPVNGEKIKLKINGLIDGNVYPVEEILTNENGKAMLTYQAGDKDRKITIQAEYKPKIIPETVKGEATVNVIGEAVWTGTLSYRRNYNETREHQDPDSSTTAKTQEIVIENADFVIHGWPFSNSCGLTGINLFYKGDESSVTGSYSGTYKFIYIIQREGEVGVITDTAFCNGTIRDSGYLEINNEEMKTFLDIGLSFEGDEQCQGQTIISGPNGSATTDFHWDQHLTFAGMGFLETTFSTKNPKTITGSYSLPVWGITWTWNLSLTER